jgi:hypothetical protein
MTTSLRAAVALWLSGVCLVAAPVPKPRPDQSPILNCTIKADASCPLGSRPQVTVTLTNRTADPIYLVGSLDGSSWKRRFPHCYFELTGPDGQPVVVAVSRCKWMNALREKDFAKVPRGGTFNPYSTIDEYGFFSAHQLSPEFFKRVGKYRLRFVYSTEESDITKWYGHVSQPNLVAMFRQIPKTTVKSNEVIVEIVPGK